MRLDLLGVLDAVWHPRVGVVTKAERLAAGGGRHVCARVCEHPLVQRMQGSVPVRCSGQRQSAYTPASLGAAVEVMPTSFRLRDVSHLRRLLVASLCTPQAIHVLQARRWHGRLGSHWGDRGAGRGHPDCRRIVQLLPRKSQGGIEVPPVD